ncbi:hypothetical protein GCM10027157_14300 [Corynebacterium aquatimens]
MPRDAPAAVNGDDWLVVVGQILGLRALARGVRVGVLEHKKRIDDLPSRTPFRKIGLHFPRLYIIHEPQMPHLYGGI